MNWRTFAKRRGRLFVAWGATLWYLFVALGVPVDTAAMKDVSRPFPCMFSRCGCCDAEQCYRHCCCHTAHERLAFAAKHGVTPPEELIAAAANESLTIDDSARDCCTKSQSPKVKVCCAPIGATQVVIHEAMKCRGLATDWLHSGAAIPAVVCEFVVFSPRVALSPIVSHFGASPVYAPDSPPPRLG